MDTQLTNDNTSDIRFPETDGKTIVYERDGYLFHFKPCHRKGSKAFSENPQRKSWLTADPEELGVRSLKLLDFSERKPNRGRGARRTVLRYLLEQVKLET